MRMIAAVAVAGSVLSGVASPALAVDHFHLTHPHRAIDEGGDSRPCATDQESDVVFSHESRMTRIRKVLDTNGTKVRKSALDGSMSSATGVPDDEIAAAPWRYREIRSYPICADVAGYSTFLIEYNTRTGRAVQMLMA